MTQPPHWDHNGKMLLAEVVLVGTWVFGFVVDVDPDLVVDFVTGFVVDFVVVVDPPDPPVIDISAQLTNVCLVL